jgi:hypothetical protein
MAQESHQRALELLAAIDGDRSQLAELTELIARRSA